MTVYSIGFTRKSAEQFFGALRAAGVRQLVDVRLHNSSTLAGFTKSADLPFFLREVCGAEYRHEPLLAPSEELFRAIKGRKIGWDEYAARFLRLLGDRRVSGSTARCSRRPASCCAASPRPTGATGAWCSST